MTLRELRILIAEDQFRYRAKKGWQDFVYQWFHEPGFRFTVVMRSCAYLRSQKLTRYGLYHVVLFWHRHQQIKYSTYIDFSSQIGGGLYLQHACAIVINTEASVGRDVTVGQNVTIGNSNQRSKYPGVPILGDRIFLGPGAVVIGGIHVGNDCAIGPNSVVTQTLPPMAVVSGVPAKLLSMRGSHGYVSNTTSQRPDAPES